MPKTAAVEGPKRVAKNHIYKVEINGEVKLVRATSRARAIKNFTKDISAIIPTADELVELVQAGIVVEQLGS